MNNWQFAMACISSIAALVGSSWIVSQSISRSRTATEEFQKTMVEALTKNVVALTENKKNPDYEKRLENLQGQYNTLSATTASNQTAIAVLTHAHSNIKMSFEGLNSKYDDITHMILRGNSARGKA